MVMDDLIKFILECRWKVGQVFVGTHLGFVFLGDEWGIVQRVNGGIKIWLGMPKFQKDWATIQTMKHMVVFIGLVGEPAVIKEHIEQTLAAFLAWAQRGLGIPQLRAGPWSRLAP